MPDQYLCEGGCLCGAVRYRATGDPIWVCHCHCRICQRHTGAAFATFVGFSSEQVTWSKRKPSLYRSSKLAERGFCDICGSTLSFRRAHKSEVSVSAVSLDHPDSMTPEFHMMTATQMPWCNLNDELPSHDRFPPGGQDRDTGP